LVVIAFLGSAANVRADVTNGFTAAANSPQGKLLLDFGWRFEFFARPESTTISFPMFARAST
jgi:hypothetical protein